MTATAQKERATTGVVPGGRGWVWTCPACGAVRSHPERGWVRDAAAVHQQAVCGTGSRPAYYPELFAGCEVHIGWAVCQLDDQTSHIADIVRYRSGWYSRTLCRSARVADVDDRDAPCDPPPASRAEILAEVSRRQSGPPEDRVCARCVAVLWASSRELEGPTMTAEEATWVREHAWLPKMRTLVLHRDPCRWVVCLACHHGEHQECEGEGPGPASRGRMTRQDQRPLRASSLITSPRRLLDLTAPAVFDLHHEVGVWCSCALADHQDTTTQPASAAPRRPSRQTTIFDFM
ncbi:MAG: hypothetical protein Q4C85_08550 [Actinomyces sp.]|uniref:hypothetical protein n=1 Tax=Actinomyces sp. TaxID=29317 RepID=UPI0026DD9FB9|nr:hypothetical protein [Actinomyces sp.]MDO4243787.1 hypothetical protein [Actinomyces sp.]